MPSSLTSFEIVEPSMRLPPGHCEHQLLHPRPQDLDGPKAAGA